MARAGRQLCGWHQRAPSITDASTSDCGAPASRGDERRRTWQRSAVARHSSRISCTANCSWSIQWRRLRPRCYARPISAPRRAGDAHWRSLNRLRGSHAGQEIRTRSVESSTRSPSARGLPDGRPARPVPGSRGDSARRRGPYATHGCEGARRSGRLPMPGWCRRRCACRRRRTDTRAA